MYTRREALRSLAWVAAAAASGSVAAGCAKTPATGSSRTLSSDQASGLAESDKTRLAAGVEDRPFAVNVVSSFTTDLYRRLAVDSGNLVASPYSVAAALAMTRNGAHGTTAAEMDAVLHAPELDRLNRGMNALTALIESRAGSRERADGSQATVALDVANSLWGQRDTAWRRRFLDALATHYGAGMRLVDYRADPEAARDLINAWTSRRTHQRIPEILPAGVLDGLSRLVLVDAIYLKAPWEQPFEKQLTRLRPFTRDDGSRVNVDTMKGMLEGAGFGAGPGWQAARMLYAGGQLAMTVILPDRGGLSSWEQSLDGDRPMQILASVKTVPVLGLQLPRWTFRTQAQLNDHLTSPRDAHGLRRVRS
ncbi:MAG: serpin family protein [Nocardioidaceae bacterium]